MVEGAAACCISAWASGHPCIATVTTQVAKQIVPSNVMQIGSKTPSEDLKITQNRQNIIGYRRILKSFEVIDFAVHLSPCLTHGRFTSSRVISRAGAARRFTIADTEPITAVPRTWSSHSRQWAQGKLIANPSNCYCTFDILWRLPIESEIPATDLIDPTIYAQDATMLISKIYEPLDVLQKTAPCLDGDPGVADGLRHRTGAAAVKTPASAKATHDGTAIPVAVNPSGFHKSHRRTTRCAYRFRQPQV